MVVYRIVHSTPTQWIIERHASDEGPQIIAGDFTSPDDRWSLRPPTGKNRKTIHTRLWVARISSGRNVEGVIGVRCITFKCLISMREVPGSISCR